MSSPAAGSFAVRRSPLDRSVVFTGRGYRVERTWGEAVEAERNPRLAKASGGMFDEDAALDELLELLDRGTVQYRSHGDAQQARLFEHGGRRPRPRVGPRHFPKLAAMLEARGGAHVAFVIAYLGVADEHGEVGELLRTVGREIHPTIGRRLDGRDLNPAGRRSHRWSPATGGERREDGGEGDHADGHAVENGHVDVATDAGVVGAPPRRQRPDGGVGPGQPLADPASRGEGGRVREAAAARGTAGRLQREFGCGATHPGSRRPEQADGDDDLVGVGPTCRQDVEVRAGDNDVRRPHDPFFVSTRYRSLGRVEEVEEAGDVGPPTVSGIDRFDHHDIGAGIGQQLGAVGPGQTARQVGDAKVPEHHRCVVPPYAFTGMVMLYSRAALPPMMPSRIDTSSISSRASAAYCKPSG